MPLGEMLCNMTKWNGYVLGEEHGQNEKSISWGYEVLFKLRIWFSGGKWKKVQQYFQSNQVQRRLISLSDPERKEDFVHNSHYIIDIGDHTSMGRDAARGMLSSYGLREII